MHWPHERWIDGADRSPGDGRSAAVSVACGRRRRAMVAIAALTLPLWTCQGATARPPLEIATLVPPDAGPADEAGRAVAAAGGRVLVGMPSAKPDGEVLRGSAWVHRAEADGTWTPEARLADPAGGPGHEFGFSVAIDDLGDGELVAIVGAWRKSLGSISRAGGASIFRFTEGSWNHEANLVAGDPSANAEFGRSVAIRGDLALVGAWRAGFSSNGAVYVFTRSPGGAWQQTQKLVPPGNAIGDHHGTSLALDRSGERAIAGAWGDDSGASNGGAATVWRRGASGAFLFEARLIGTDLVAGDEIGRGVAIDGDLAVAGGWSFFGDGRGKAYAFRRGGTVWTQEAKLVAPDAMPDDYFGFSVAVRRGEHRQGVGDLIACGAWADDLPSGVNAGSVWLFRRTAVGGDPQGGWVAESQLLAPDGAASDYFGFSLAFLCEALVVGVRLDDTPAGVNSGSARVWWVEDLDGDGQVDRCAPLRDPADLDGDGRVNAVDLAILLGAWGTAGPGDLDGDGVVGAADLALLLAAWSMR